MSSANATHILSILPHRFPFLMIDRLIDVGPEHATALKNVSLGEPYFAGHFPNEPIMPGEALAQTAAFIGSAPAVAVQSVVEFLPLGRKVLLTSINLRFKHPVVPGDQLRLEVKLLKRMGHVMKVLTRATVDGKDVAGGDLVLAFH
jgi:3-hydroxyacyl-[acyl-carrier-protein] dehydratase